jgi:hypothetical protein
MGMRGLSFSFAFAWVENFLRLDKGRNKMAGPDCPMKLCFIGIQSLQRVKRKIGGKRRLMVGFLG